MADRVSVLMDETRSVLQRFDGTQVVVEWPRFFGSAKGRTAADKGDLGKLYLSASSIFCEAIRFGASAELIDVNQWKGQLNKAAVIYHIRRRLEVSDTYFKSHEWDAVGLGLSFLGCFL